MICIGIKLIIYKGYYFSEGLKTIKNLISATGIYLNPLVVHEVAIISKLNGKNYAIS